MFSKKYVRNSALILVCLAFFVAVFIVSKNSLTGTIENYDYRTDFFAMDTVVSVRSQSDITGVISDIFKEYQSALDCNNENSETSKLNTDGIIIPSDILYKTISDTLLLNSKYGNLTDITIGRLTSLWNVTAEKPVVPEKELIESALNTINIENVALTEHEAKLKNGCAIDFGAVGKGAALDTCLYYLKENSCGKTYISTGSSILLYGDNNFDVNINNPNGGILASVKTPQCFVSTSGGYERYFEADGKTYCHIIDPKTGYPTETDLTTVTVFCQSGIESDFLSTLIFIDGSKNIEKYLKSEDYKIFAADKNQKLYISEGLNFEVYDDTFRE